MNADGSLAFQLILARIPSKPVVRGRRYRIYLLYYLLTYRFTDPADFSGAWTTARHRLDASMPPAMDGFLWTDDYRSIMQWAERKKCVFYGVVATFFKRMAAAIWWRRMHWHLLGHLAERGRRPIQEPVQYHW